MRDQIAHTIMTYSWTTEAMKDMESPIDAYELVDMILEKTIRIRWCVVHQRSVSDERSTACLSGGKVRCHIEVRYLLRSGPPPHWFFSDEDVVTVQDAIQSETGVRLSERAIRASLQQLTR